MTGESLEELWRTPLLVLQITSLRRFSVAMAMDRIVTGGLLVQSCLNVRSVGPLSVPRMPMIPTERSSIGGNLFTSRKTFS